MLATSPELETLCDANGVDREQIREMLRLTPEERLARIGEFLADVAAIREPKDAAVLPFLEATLDEIRKKS